MFVYYNTEVQWSCLNCDLPNNCNNKNYLLLAVFNRPGTGLESLYVLAHFIPTIILRDRQYYAH